MDDQDKINFFEFIYDSIDFLLNGIHSVYFSIFYVGIALLFAAQVRSVVKLCLLRKKINLFWDKSEKKNFEDVIPIFKKPKKYFIYRSYYLPYCLSRYFLRRLVF